jgi:hypothetical protein
VAFTVGLLALALWALHLGRRAEGPGPLAGGFIVSSTSVINGAGTLAPLVLALHVGSSEGQAAVARALLGLTLAFDALFNLGLAFGFLLMATSTKLSRFARAWLVIAGLAALPVAGQAIWDDAANALYFAAPLWLLFILFSSMAFWRNRAL